MQQTDAKTSQNLNVFEFYFWGKTLQYYNSLTMLFQMYFMKFLFNNYVPTFSGVDLVDQAW